MTAKTQFLFKYNELCDKIDLDYSQIIKSNSSLEDIHKKLERCIREIINGKEELMCFYIQNHLAEEIRIDEIIKEVNLHERKFLKLIQQIGKILEKKKCCQCSKGLTKIWVYFWKDRAREWTISNKIGNFDEWDHNPLLFCNENCFQQSIYSKKQEQKPKTRKKTKKSKTPNQPSSNQSKEYTCWGCYETKNGKYYAKEGELEYCSLECYQESCGELCNQCVSRCLTYYHGDNSNIIYCENCHEKNQQEEREQENQTSNKCQYCSAKIDKAFDTCEKEECLKKMVDEIENTVERESNFSNPSPI